MTEEKMTKIYFETIELEGVPVFYQKQLCELFKIKQRTFQNWDIKPRLIQGRRKYYKAADLVTLLENRAKKAQKPERIFYDKEGEPFTLSEVEASKKRAKALALEFQVRQFYEKYIPAEMVPETTNIVIDKFLECLLSLPQRGKSEIPELTDEVIADISILVGNYAQELADMKAYHEK